jgi:CheY-like chemotaxis protein
MSPHVKEHVFEPFFTTKPIGEGAGLGLSAVYGVVKQLNGFIWVESELGEGSTFHVYLPPAQDESAERVAPEPIDEQSSTGTRQTILLVEDQDTVRRFARRALEHHGYCVIEAATPEEALARAQGGQPLSLLLTDVIMPRMSGPELADALRQTRPDLPVLFMSGFPSTLVMPDGSIDPRRPMVSKPFTTSQLIQVVQELLGTLNSGR